MRIPADRKAAFTVSMAVALVSILLAIVLWYAMTQADVDRSSPTKDEATTASHHVVDASPHGRTEIPLPQPPRDSITILVEQPDGSPVESARIIRASGRFTRIYEEGSQTTIGATDADGRLVFEAEGDSSDVVVHKPGFLSTQVSALKRGETRLVVIHHGVALTVHAITSLGDPVPDATISVGRHDVMDPRARVGTPGPDPDTALHVAVTDARGVASFSSLHPGVHAAFARHSTMAMSLAELARASSFPVPGPPVRLVLDQPHGFALRIVGDTMLASRIRCELPGESAIDAASSDGLRRRFPEAVSSAFSAVPPGKRVTGVVQMFCGRRGWIQRTFSSVPLSSLDTAQTVDVSDEPVKHATGVLRLRLSSHPRDQVDPSELPRLLARAKSLDLSVRVDFDRPIELPVGEYRLELQPGGPVGAELEVSEGATTDHLVSLAGRRRVQLIVRDQEGRPLSAVRYSATFRTQPPESGVRRLEDGRMVLWIDGGPSTITVGDARGRDARVIEIDAAYTTAEFIESIEKEVVLR